MLKQMSSLVTDKVDWSFHVERLGYDDMGDFVATSGRRCDCVEARAGILSSGTQG